MSLAKLEEKIAALEEAAESLKKETQEAHGVLKDIRAERKIVQRLMGDDIRKMVEERVAAVVKEELDQLGPQLRDQTSQIYDKVGNEIDKLIRICLGREYSDRIGKEDLRPKLAARLRETILEVMAEAEEAT